MILESDTSEPQEYEDPKSIKTESHYSGDPVNPSTIYESLTFDTAEEGAVKNDGDSDPQES